MEKWIETLNNFISISTILSDPRRDPYCAADASKQDENCDENGDIEHGYRVDTKREIKERKKRKKEGDKKERIYE